jgi:thiol:disulfide interchange protein DsbC
MKSILFLLAMFISGGALATGFDIAEYNKANADYKVTAAKATDLPGIFEVTFADGGVGYMDAEAKFLLVGYLFDLKSKKMLTPTVGQGSAQSQAQKIGAAAQPQPQRININSLPLNGAIKIVRGNGKGRLVLFSDPDCPYCKELEHNISKLENVTVYVFPYPVAELHPNAAEKAASAYCHANPATGWRIATLGGGALPRPNEACRKKVAATVKLGDHLGLTMTPTMFNGAGQRRTGAISAQELSQWIQ